MSSDFGMNPWPLESIVPARPLSGCVINQIAEEMLAIVAPEHLLQPDRLNLAYLMEIVLPKWGIHFEPITSEEAGGNEAFVPVRARESPSDDISIFVREDIYNAVRDNLPNNNRWRATIAHEIGHAILHTHWMRQWLAQQNEQTFVLARRARGEVDAFRDPEWQAWMFAGCFLAPPKTMAAMQRASLHVLCSRYGMSRSFMTNHLDRCNRLLGER